MQIPVLGELHLGELFPNSLVTPKEINEFLATFRNESDRGAVLALAAAFDEVLARAIRKHLKQSEPGDKLLDKVFDFNGSLGTFSGRIDMARCLGLINPQCHADIHRIRKLRNEAAHHWSDFKLTDERVQQFVDPLHSPINVLTADPSTDPTAASVLLPPLTKLSFMAFHLLSIGASAAA